jgi:carboxypeptidase Taq
VPRGMTTSPTGSRNPGFDELRTRLAEIHDIGVASRLLGWDQLVKMPRTGAAVRAEQSATLHRLSHDRFTDESIGRLLDDLRPYEESLDHDSDEASLIRVARRDWEKARRIPTALAGEMSKAASAGMEAWARARADDDFASFRPWLDRQLELKQEYIACFEAGDEPYDVLLDDFEPGMKTAEVRTVFARLKEVLVPLVAAVGSDREPRFVGREFAEDAQRDLSLAAMEAFGYASRSMRFDPTVHPFCTSMGTQDIRVTSRFSRDDLRDGLFASMHEIGHGLYEHGVSTTLERTLLCEGCSSALHESQSRLWENLVGRSLPFWRWFFPKARQAFPDALGDITLEELHRAVNTVHPSHIRVEADEVTYGLHIVLRFELEQELIGGRLSTADLPDAWNELFEQYLGIPVPDDRHGVLQDVHWSGGSFGYFPTYQLGNVISVQVWERAVAELGSLDDEFARGDFSRLGAWLRDNLYLLGRKHTPQETLERVVGGPIDPEPYLAYLQAKADAVAIA